MTETTGATRDAAEDRLPRPRRRRRHVVRLGVALVATAALVTGGMLVWSDARAQFGRTRADLAATTRRLDTTRGHLHATSRQLTRAERELAVAVANLKARTAERKEAEGALVATQVALEDTRSSLQHRRAQLDDGQSRLVYLVVCVLGASEALNQIAVNDVTGFQATLRRIDDACTTARSGT